ncbi:(E)-4-hydroxy-3-methylbut-2-enyl-diphosphate synthase [Bacteroidales bacterium OttesenSCG-928-K22]|nr:(E)-4-hydroxy-3-methylbut-2-enyl-diphosphate synthase [Bacteroidales bacterium OttesenSCG-928-L14]MDL2240588.1 (E)-4-hydroxy-3-methylbut-2-enyl-diphosphate synthase [Bacteroidales bacterium OttesenSCG-928-K22]
MPEFVKIGNLYVGKQFPVRVQSMLNTNTSNVEDCVAQSIELVEAGCEMIRLSTRNIKDAQNLYNIKNELCKKNIEVPIIADIHFNPKVAEIAASIADKIRINPGNYIDKALSKSVFTEEDNKIAIEKATEALYGLTEICKQNNTVIRVGSNQGSLSERIVYQYGDTAKGMVASVNEFVKIFEELDFDKLVVSLKSSNPLIMIEANRLFIKEMNKQSLYYPIHLGVTEAGSGMEGRVKSTVGIGTLLSEGIGDTIRVSLSENPVNEIAPAKEIAECKASIKYNEIENFERIKINNSTEKFTIVGKDIAKNELDNDVIFVDLSDKNLADSVEILNNLFTNKIEKPVVVETQCIASLQSCIASPQTNIASLQYVQYIASLLLNYPISGIYTNINEELLKDILQATKLRLSKPEYISCPTCARTEYDLLKVLEDVKYRSKHLKNIKIAVMGCIVNGPGEMRGADIGIVGYGKGKVVMFIDGKQTGEPFPAEESGKRLNDVVLNFKK